MGSRRQARETTVQILYQRDINPHEPLDDSLRRFWDEQPPDPELRAFAEELARGVLDKRLVIDAEIKKVTENWEIDRIAAVDRNILRLAIYEMLFRTDVPPVVSINEAIEIAKKFSTRESGKFVNGILDRIRKELSRPARTSSETAAPAPEDPASPK